MRGAENSDAVIFAALEKVGLRGFEEQPCFSLSAGQQRRVNLARLFCIPAKLWILDEPFTAIDQGGVSEIERWLSEFVHDGGAVLLTTHHQLNIARGFDVVNLGDTVNA